MSRHTIAWEYDCGVVTARAVCHEPPGADCRLTGGNDCTCEEWGKIRRDPDGTIWHELTADHRDFNLPDDEPQWHQVIPQDDCNICLFINESGHPGELGYGMFTIAETPINPIWNGYGYDWEPAETVRPTGDGKE